MSDQWDEVIDVAEKYAENYDGDDRPFIKTDVLNAFYAGYDKGQKSLRAQLAEANRKIQDLLSSKGEENAENN